MTDIVEMLRDYATPITGMDTVLAADAADEITSLRAELAAIKGQEPTHLQVRCELNRNWQFVDAVQYEEYISHGWEGRKLYALPVAPVADKDAERPTIKESLIVAANKDARLSCVKDLIEVVRMPNAEWVADAHNAAVKKLRAMAKGE